MAGKYRIDPLEKEIPDAYHGTDYESARGIVAGSKFTPSKGKDQYLGEGVYFFEGSQWHAKDWAKRKAEREEKKEYAVIEATVSLGKLLDFNNGDHRRYIRFFAQELEKKRGVPKLNDAIVINLLAKQTTIDTIKATYCRPEMGKVFDNSRFFYYTCPILCVRNMNNIKEPKIVEYDVAG